MKLINFILFIICFCLPAYAADPFLSETEEDGTYAEEVRKTREQAIQSEQYSGALAELPAVEQSLKEQSNFRGTIDVLLNKAKPEPEEEKKAWTQFDAIEGTEAEIKFLESGEYKIRSELEKPIERRNTFSNNLDNIKNSLGSIEEKTAVSEDDFFNSSK